MFPLALFLIITPMTVEEVASAIYNNIEAGLVGIHANPTLSMDQLEDEVVATREAVIFEWWKKGILQKGDLLAAINCIEVDCKDLTKCCKIEGATPQHHFEIPQLIPSLGDEAVYYAGSVDRAQKFKVYLTPSQIKYHKYKKRANLKPFIYIEPAKNEHGMYDGWIYNLPYVKNISLVGIFRDPRDLKKIGCDGNCDNSGGDIGTITREVIDRLTKQWIYFYRQALQLPHVNDQTAR